MASLPESTNQLQQRAERQHGLIHISQLLELGPPARRRALRRAVGLTEVTSTVFRVAGSPPTPLQSALAAVLDAGTDGFLTHISSAGLWGIPGFPLDPPHVTAGRQRSGERRSMLATIHRPRLIMPHHVTELDNIPVTVPSRMLFDLANMGLHEKRVERALDSAWAMGIVDSASLTRMLGELSCRGRRGIAVMRRLIEERSADYRAPESGLEFRFRSLLREASLPDMQPQADIGDGERWLGRVDFMEPDARLIVQINSERYHSALVDRRRDEEQSAALRAAGWTILAFTDVDLWHRARQVVDTVRTTRAQLRTRGAA